MFSWFKKKECSLCKAHAEEFIKKNIEDYRRYMKEVICRLLDPDHSYGHYCYTVDFNKIPFEIKKNIQNEERFRHYCRSWNIEYYDNYQKRKPYTPMGHIYEVDFNLTYNQALTIFKDESEKFFAEKARIAANLKSCYLNLQGLP